MADRCHAGHYDVERLETLLAAFSADSLIHLSYLQSCGSTNAECLKLNQDGALVITDHQSGGRGRRGNEWHSPDAGNIYMSLGMDLSLSPELLGLVALQVGVCAAEVLHAAGYAAVTLKWPNDLMLEGRKLGGILIETRTVETGRFFVAIGLGLNVCADREVFASVGRPVASLAEQGKRIDRELLVAQLAHRIYQDVAALSESGVAALIGRFQALDALLGLPVRVQTRQDETRGLYDGIERDGRIRVIVDGQGPQLFASAEISLREDADAAD